MNATNKHAEWSYNYAVRNAIRMYVSGKIDICYHFDTLSRFWHPKVSEGARNAEALNLVMEFMASFASIPAKEYHVMGDESFGLILYGIKRLELASKCIEDSARNEESELENILIKLTGKVVCNTVMAFCHNKHRSRILYNQYKSTLSRPQQQGCELVLKGLISAEKVVQSGSEYLQTVKEMVGKFENLYSPALIEKVAKKLVCSESFLCNAKDLTEDTDMESVDVSESLHVVSNGSDESGTGLVADSRNSTKRKFDNTASGVSNQIPAKSLERDSSPHTSSAIRSPTNRRKPDVVLMPPPLFKTNSKPRLKPKFVKNINRDRQPVSASKRPKPRKLPITFKPMRDDVGNKSMISTSTSLSSRTKHSFTPLQDAYIILGMIKYREKKQLWCEIFKKYPFPEYRKPMHLKDRWRTLLKRGDVQIEDKKIVASQKYEAIFAHLYSKYENDGDLETGQSGSKRGRRLITSDESVDLDDSSIDDLSEDKNLPQQQASSHSKILKWLNSNVKDTENCSLSEITSTEVIEGNKPETSGFSTKFYENRPGNNDARSSDEEDPINPIILQPSKNMEYVENAHGKYLPNSRCKTSIESTSAHAMQTTKLDTRIDRDRTTQKTRNESPIRASVEENKSSAHEETVPDDDIFVINVKNRIQISNNNPLVAGEESGVQADADDIIVTNPKKAVPFDQENNGSIVSNKETGAQIENEIIDLKQEDSSHFQSRYHKASDPSQKNGNISVKLTDSKDTSSSSGQPSNTSLSALLLKATEESLHCELKGEEDSSCSIILHGDTAIPTSNTTGISNLPDASESSLPMPASIASDSVKTVEPIPSICNVMDTTDIADGTTTQSNVVPAPSPRNGVGGLDQLDYNSPILPASPSTCHTATSPTNSSVYMTAGEDSDSFLGEKSEDKISCNETITDSNLPNNIQQLLDEENYHEHTPIKNASESVNLHENSDDVSQLNTIDASTSTEDVIMSDLNDSGPVSTILSSTRICNDSLCTQKVHQGQESSKTLTCYLPIVKLNSTVGSPVLANDDHVNDSNAPKENIQEKVPKRSTKDKTFGNRTSSRRRERSDKSSEMNRICTRQQIAHNNDKLNVKIGMPSLRKRSKRKTKVTSGLKNVNEKNCVLKSLPTNRSNDGLEITAQSSTTSSMKGSSGRPILAGTTVNNNILPDSQRSPMKTFTYRRKRRILRDHGAPLKISKEDEVFFCADSTKNRDPKAFTTRGKARQTSRKKWSSTEDMNIISGVKIHGEGNWKAILKNYRFSNRTATNLKDRYRVIK